MKETILEIVIYVVIAVVMILVSMWLTQLVWDSSLPEWLKIWLIAD